MGDDAKLYIEMQEPGFWNWVERCNGKYDGEDDGIKEYKEKIEFKRYFLVDYENVNREGLNGITKLSSEDCVRVYYSDSAETITFRLHRRINASKAHFDYIKVEIPIKNAVDCQILFDIRDLAKENKNAEYFIVSKDTDFDKAIDVFNAHNLKVKKVLEICKRDETAKKEQSKKVEQKQPTKAESKKVTTKTGKDKREAQVRLTAIGALKAGYKVILNTSVIGTIFEMQKVKA